MQTSKHFEEKLLFKMRELAKYKISQPTNRQPVRETMGSHFKQTRMINTLVAFGFSFCLVLKWGYWFKEIKSSIFSIEIFKIL